MLTVKNIAVSDQFGLDRLYITFSIVDTVERIDGYRFDVYRSLDASDDFEEVAYDVTDFSFADYSVNLHNIGLTYYYKILVTEIASGDFGFSEVVASHMVSQPDPYASAIMEVERIYLTNVVSNTMVTLRKRRHGGQLCNCFDEVRRKGDPSCPLCFGTRYVGGYYSPQLILVNYANTASKQRNLDTLGDVEMTAPLQLWTGNFPLINNEDIIIDQFNRAYVVTNWVPSYKNSFLLRQTIAITFIPRSSTVYKILLPSS